MAEVLDSKSRVDDLLFIAGHLIDLLETENIALKASKLDVVESLIEQKTKLSRAYEMRVLGMQKSEQDFSDVEPVLIEELKTQSARLQELVEINAQELEISIATGKRYMEVVAESVKQAAPSAGTYGSNGTKSHDVQEKAKPSSLAINENL